MIGGWSRCGARWRENDGLGRELTLDRGKAARRRDERARQGGRADVGDLVLNGAMADLVAPDERGDHSQTGD